MDSPELHGKVVEVVGTGNMSWFSLEPTPEKASGSICVEKFQRSLPCGAYLVLRNSNVIGRIFSHYSAYIRVNLFRLVHDCDQGRHWGCDFGQRPPRLTDMNLRNIKQVFQTNEIATIGYDDVADIAFVFRPSEIETLPFHAQGISNLFILRCRMGGEPIPCGQCLPFHSSYKNITTEHSIECYPSLVWKHIEEVRVHLLKGLCRTGQRQGQGLVRAHESMFCSPHFVQYLKTRSSDFVIAWNPIADRKVKRRKVSAALTRSTVSQVHKDCQLIRFESHTQLQLFCEVFGETAIAGCRKRYPRAGTEKLVLKENDPLNIINGTEDDVEANVAISIVSNKQGIDLIYDGTKMCARVRHRTYIFNAEDVEDVEEEDDNGPLSSQIMSIIKATTNDELEPPSYAGPRVGSAFVRGEATHEVECVHRKRNGDIVDCVNIDDITDRKQCTIDNVRRYIAADRA